MSQRTQSMTYRGAMHQTHPELGPLEPGRDYEVTDEQLRWLSADAGWEPTAKPKAKDSEEDGA